MVRHFMKDKKEKYFILCPQPWHCQVVKLQKAKSSLVASKVCLLLEGRVQLLYVVSGQSLPSWWRRHILWLQLLYEGGASHILWLPPQSSLTNRWRQTVPPSPQNESHHHCPPSPPSPPSPPPPPPPPPPSPQNESHHHCCGHRLTTSD